MTISALVTGASGFIGTHLVRRLIAHGYAVTCIVRATSPVGAQDFMRVNAGGAPGVTRQSYRHTTAR